MRLLFTIISIESRLSHYLESAKLLTNEILNKTKHDVIISTNRPDYFDNLKSDRLVIRNNIRENSIIDYPSGEFNYNLKHHAFLELPENYDYIIYLDCDIKLHNWTEKSDEWFINEMEGFDFAADGLNRDLKNMFQWFLNDEDCLFKHKLNSYDFKDRYKIEDELINNTFLPSEHILIFKNEPKKIKSFQESWEKQNNYLQDKNGGNGSWGDGFEIGVSAFDAGFNKIKHLGTNYWKELFGFEFNGNKYPKLPT